MEHIFEESQVLTPGIRIVEDGEMPIVRILDHDRRVILPVGSRAVAGDGQGQGTALAQTEGGDDRDQGFGNSILFLLH